MIIISSQNMGVHLFCPSLILHILQYFCCYSSNFKGRFLGLSLTLTTECYLKFSRKFLGYVLLPRGLNVILTIYDNSCLFYPLTPSNNHTSRAGHGQICSPCTTNYNVCWGVGWSFVIILRHFLPSTFTLYISSTLLPY